MASLSSSDEVPILIAMEVQARALSTSELEVIQWLESIEYERYQQNFVAVDIFSLDIVREILSAEELEELGIPKFSARALMKHIVELKANGFTAPPGGSAGAGEENDDTLKKERVGEEKVETSTTTMKATGSPMGNPGGPQPKTKEELKKWIQEYCKGEKNHGEPNTWDVTLVTDMSYLFVEMTKFNAPIDQWNTSKVTNMKGMFAGASWNVSIFNQPIKMDTSKVTDMSYMFCHASSFNQPITMDTSQVMDMRCMFSGASSFNQPITMDTSNVTNMDDMFDGAIAMTHPKPSLSKAALEAVSKFF